MNQEVHLVPVGFDYHRLLAPLTSPEGMPIDRAVLFYSTEDSTRDDHDSDRKTVSYISEVVRRVRNDMVEMVGLDENNISMKPINDNYDQTDILPLAYKNIQQEVEQGNNVYLNLSSMPRTVALGFSLAGNYICFQNPTYREQIHPYYVAPDQYLITKFIDEIQDVQKAQQSLKALEDMLSDFQREDIIDAEYKSHIEDLGNMLGNMADLLTETRQYGVTRGARKFDGKKYINMPNLVDPGLTDIEADILATFSESNTFESISDIAKSYADQEGIEYSNSIRSKVQYNIGNLEEKGYVSADKSGKNYSVELTNSGEAWFEVRSSDVHK